MVSEEEGKDGRVEEWERAIERLDGEPDGIYSGEFAGSWVSLCSIGISIALPIQSLDRCLWGIEFFGSMNLTDV